MQSLSKCIFACCGGQTEHRAPLIVRPPEPPLFDRVRALGIDLDLHGPLKQALTRVERAALGPLLMEAYCGNCTYRIGERHFVTKGSQRDFSQVEFTKQDLALLNPRLVQDKLQDAPEAAATSLSFPDPKVPITYLTHEQAIEFLREAGIVRDKAPEAIEILSHSQTDWALYLDWQHSGTISKDSLELVFVNGATWDKARLDQRQMHASLQVIDEQAERVQCCWWCACCQ